MPDERRELRKYARLATHCSRRHSLYQNPRFLARLEPQKLTAAAWLQVKLPQCMTYTAGSVHLEGVAGGRLGKQTPAVRGQWPGVMELLRIERGRREPGECETNRNKKRRRERTIGVRRSYINESPGTIRSRVSRSRTRLALTEIPASPASPVACRRWSACAYTHRAATSRRRT